MKPHQADPERQRAKERRRLAERRQEFLRSRLSARLPKGSAVELLVGALIDRVNTNDAGRAGALLEIVPLSGHYADDWHSPLAQLAARSEADRLRVGVALASAMAEARIAACGYRDGGSRYVEFLCTLGYERAPDEAAPGTESPVEAARTES